jgi:type I restriction enzyme M protein
MLDQETKKRIDDCRNILVGKVPDPKSQVEQITIAMIYKFMYDMDLESLEMGGISTYFVGEYEKYSWGNIFNPRIGGNEMISLYGEGIVKMNLNPNIPQLFRDIFKNAYLPYRDPETLKLFLKGINEFHYSHSEKLGDAFEYLLSVLGSQGDAGQFRTPRHIIDFIVDLIQPKKNERINDPACGTSGFLISSYKHILRNNTKKNLGDLITPDERNKLVENISGYDISPDMVRLSLVNLYLHNFSNPKIYEYDSLTSEDRWNEYYDVILANPPFMSPKGGIKPHKRFSIQSNRAEVLFVDYIMEHLTPKGRSGIVVPEGIIFQSGIAYKSLRKSLVEKYLVGVISLPSGVFQPYSGVKTSILILDKELSQKTDKIFFGKVDNDGFDLGAQRREIEKSDLPILTKEVTEYLEGLRKGKVVESERLTYVPKEQILDSSDFGLSYERYVTKQLVDRNYPMMKIGDFCETSSGGTPLKNREDFYNNGNIPWIRSGEVGQGIVTKSEGFITEEGLKNSSAKLFPVNTTLVAMYGATAGQVGLLKISSTTNQAICGILPNDKIIPEYLYYILKSKRQEFIDLSSGGAQPNISQNIIREFEIPLPPIEVQEEIVRELEQYQKIIDGAKQVVDNYKPVIDIDPSWEMKRLDEIGKVCMCKRIFKEQTNIKGDVPFYKIGTFGGDPDSFIDVELFNEFKSKYSYPKKGDILISTSGTIGKIVEFDGLPSYFQDSNIVWITNNEEIVLNRFLKIYYQIIKWRPTEGVTIARLYNKNIEETIIPVPTLEIQQSIVERIESERQIIEGNKKLIEIYTQKIQDRINKIWGE